jgi:methylmalonyl-CoA mutase
MARNAQLILMEEAHIGRVADPLAGAWSLEALTDDLARAAWARFQAIEAAGGLIAALESGTIASDVQAGREALAIRISEGELKIIGVTDFRDVKAEATPAPRALGTDTRPVGAGSRCPPLTPLRLEDLAA